MAFLKIDNVEIKGVAAAVPKQIKEIRDLPFFTSGEGEKVVSLTKIERSRIAPEGMCCSDLCQEAADKLLTQLEWDRKEVEALIYVSLSRDYLTPPTSALLQDKLGLSKECYCIDIPLACSGYVYGLANIASLMQMGYIKKAILLVGETTSQLQSPLDKGLWPLHGDAGTATAIQYNPNAKPMFFHLCTDGSRGDAIINVAGGKRHPITPDDLVMKEDKDGSMRRAVDSVMDGMNVFGFSITEPPTSVKALCSNFDLNLTEIDYLLLHQANKYMDDKIGKKLKVEASKIPFSLYEYGNTSSATIPMTIVAGIGPKISEEDAQVVMLGFGSGLSWGAAWVNLNHISCVPLIEIE